MKETLGIVSVIIGLVGFVPYVRDILSKKTKPHLYTYLIWSIVTIVAFVGQYISGGGPGSWSTGVMGLLTIVILGLTFRYGTKDVTRFDGIFLIGALLSIVPWLFTHDATLSILIATFIDICAFIPTIRKTTKEPSSETLISWVLGVSRHITAIGALTTYTLATTVYPSALLVMNAVVVGVIMFGRNRYK